MQIKSIAILAKEDANLMAMMVVFASMAGLILRSAIVQGGGGWIAIAAANAFLLGDSACRFMLYCQAVSRECKESGALWSVLSNQPFGPACQRLATRARERLERVCELCTTHESR